MNPLALPPANPLVMGCFPASQSWAALCALPVRPTRIPMAMLTIYEMTWQGDAWVTPDQPLYRGTAAQALALTNSKEAGWSVKPRGPSDQKPKNSRDRGQRAGWRERTESKRGSGSYKHRRQDHLLIIRQVKNTPVMPPLWTFARDLQSICCCRPSKPAQCLACKRRPHSYTLIHQVCHSGLNRGGRRPHTDSEGLFLVQSIHFGNSAEDLG